MARVFTFGDKVVTDDSPSFVIAEVGHNHQGDIEKCKAIFKAAAEAGADAVKLQKRDNRALFTREMYDSALQQRERLCADLRRASREARVQPASSTCELKTYCDELGILFFSTAFDAPSADLLEEHRHAGVQDRVGRPDQYAAAQAGRARSASR